MTSMHPVTVVTGANSGIGLDAAHRLARRGGALVLLCRNEERGAPVVDAVRSASGNRDVHLVTADFSDLHQVREAGDRLASRWPRITALLNNAGLASLERRVTGDGFELTMQVNHLSPFLLTHVLLDALRQGRARVVNVASEAHRRARLRRASLEALLRGPEPYKGFQAYCDSKLANVLFSSELARREAAAGITSNALHPGTLSTAIWDRHPGWKYWAAQAMKVFMQKPAVGGEAAERLAASPELGGVTGAYYDRLEPRRPTTDAEDAALARELWDVSARAVGLA